MKKNIEAVIKKARLIRMVIFDVDGVLTTGKLFYGPHGMEHKEFHVHDGQGIKLLQKSGVEIGIITTCKTKAVTQRMKDLDIQYVYQGTLDKLAAFDDLKQKTHLTNEQIAYVGDDLPDLPVMLSVGLSIAVANASETVQRYASWITKAKGGDGAAREVCELIMSAQGTYETILAHYLQAHPHLLLKNERATE